LGYGTFDRHPIDRNPFGRVHLAEWTFARMAPYRMAGSPKGHFTESILPNGHFTESILPNGHFTENFNDFAVQLKFIISVMN